MGPTCTRCCFCISLRNGCFLIAVFSISKNLLFLCSTSHEYIEDGLFELKKELSNETVAILALTLAWCLVGVIILVAVCLKRDILLGWMALAYIVLNVCVFFIYIMTVYETQVITDQLFVRLALFLLDIYFFIILWNHYKWMDAIFEECVF